MMKTVSGFCRRFVMPVQGSYAFFERSRNCHADRAGFVFLCDGCKK
jgi:hypothetical protein